ncbi:MAG: hypothetical protein IAF08_05895 [Rhizobacter sp.]|nr:hypothetical protein [Chlorobiales bacterium]
METKSIKEEAKLLIDRLPENVGWDEIMHEIYVHQTIDAGLADSKAGRSVEVDEVRKQFGLDK